MRPQHKLNNTTTPTQDQAVSRFAVNCRLRFQVSKFCDTTKLPLHDASMVCPCWRQAAYRARNMDAAQCKEHRSTCPRSVWDATTVDIHHDAKVPNKWWAAEDTQPCVHNTSSTTQPPQLKVNLHQGSLSTAACASKSPHSATLPSCLCMMPPWFALVGDKPTAGLGIWMQRSARSITQLARGPSGTPPLWTYTTMPRCPTHGGLLRIRSHASTTQAQQHNHPNSRSIYIKVRCQLKPALPSLQIQQAYYQVAFA